MQNVETNFDYLVRRDIITDMNESSDTRMLLRCKILNA